METLLAIIVVILVVFIIGMLTAMSILAPRNYR